jgi:hemerythrin superfamily protein
MESDRDRQEARSKAQSAARGNDWLSMALNHHRQLEAAFATVKATEDADARSTAQRKLTILLTGHAIAEESVLYPALARTDEKDHALTAYAEQATAKIQMAELDALPRMSQDYLDKLEHIRGAVVHHMYEEEGTWFLELRKRVPALEQAKLSHRFKAEFERYVGGVLATAA